MFLGGLHFGERVEGSKGAHGSPTPSVLGSLLHEAPRPWPVPLTQLRLWAPVLVSGQGAQAHACQARAGRVSGRPCSDPGSTRPQQCCPVTGTSGQSTGSFPPSVSPPHRLEQSSAERLGPRVSALRDDDYTNENETGVGVRLGFSVPGRRRLGCCYAAPVTSWE